MSFVYPAFLWALAALSIPLIVHLFNFRKTQKIFFSSNRFLRMVQEATSARRRLKHYLVLASRLLFLLFLVLAFAQPFIPAKEQFSAIHRIVIYLDNSLSMAVPVADRTRALDAGIVIANQIVSTFPPETRFKLVTNDFAPFSNVFKTAPEVQELLTQVRLSPLSRTFREVKQRIDYSAGNLPQEIFWISDFQRATIGPLQPDLADSLHRLHLVPLSFEQPSNIFVDTAYLENPLVIGGEKNTLRVVLRNNGYRAIDQLLVKLTVNGIQTGTSSVAMAANGNTTATFDLVSAQRTTSQAVVSFNDYPVSFDNEFYLALNAGERIRVIEIKSAQPASAVERVFGNKEVFLFRAFDVRNINYAALREADLVVTNALDVIDASLIQAIRAYLASGGALMVIPPARPDLISYRDLLSLGTLSLVNDALHVELEIPDYNNPFFENVFEERSDRLVLPKARRVLDWGPDRSALLRLKNDRPFLSQLTPTGQVFLMASPLHPEYSDFSNNFLFLPVMYRIAASATKSDWKPYYSLDETLITIRTDSLPDQQPIRLVGQQDIIPSQRRLTDRVILELPRYEMQSGFYQAVVAQDTLGVLAFNLNSRESLLEQMSGEEVWQQLGGGGNVTLFEAGNTETFSSEIRARYLGKPLWKYALLAALFFLLVEILLIRFMK